MINSKKLSVPRSVRGFRMAVFVMTAICVAVYFVLNVLFVVMEGSPLASTLSLLRSIDELIYLLVVFLGALVLLVKSMLWISKMKNDSKTLQRVQAKNWWIVVSNVGVLLVFIGAIYSIVTGEYTSRQRFIRTIIFGIADCIMHFGFLFFLGTYLLVQIFT